MSEAFVFQKLRTARRISGNDGDEKESATHSGSARPTKKGENERRIVHTGQSRRYAKRRRDTEADGEVDARRASLREEQRAKVQRQIAKTLVNRHRGGGSESGCCTRERRSPTKPTPRQTAKLSRATRHVAHYRFLLGLFPPLFFLFCHSSFFFVYTKLTSYVKPPITRAHASGPGLVVLGVAPTNGRAHCFSGPAQKSRSRPHIRVSKRSRAPPTTNNLFLEPN